MWQAEIADPACLQVLHAIDWCHGNGVVHRRVKLKNVLYDPRCGTCKLSGCVGQLLVNNGEVVSSK